MGGSMVTLPNGVQTYIGRRGRLPDGYGDSPPPPDAVAVTAMSQRALISSPLLLPGPIPFRVLSTAGSEVLTMLPGFIVGWSVFETSGSSRAAIQLFDGENTSAQLLASIGVGAGEGSQLSVSAPGWTVRNGLYVSYATGSFDGTIWYLPADNEGSPAAAAALSGG